jgi:hypothetical protein
LEGRSNLSSGVRGQNFSPENPNLRGLVLGPYPHLTAWPYVDQESNFKPISLAQNKLNNNLNYKASFPFISSMGAAQSESGDKQAIQEGSTDGQTSTRSPEKSKIKILEKNEIGFSTESLKSKPGPSRAGDLICNFVFNFIFFFFFS